MLFCDLPDEQRLAYRDAIDAAGGVVEGYYGEFVQVCVPRPTVPFFNAMHAAGLLVMDGMYFFPLGSDRAPDHLRHDGLYPGSRGFWLHARCKPISVLS